MGCAESRLQAPSQPLLSDFDQQPSTSMPRQNPFQALHAGHAVQLSTQHERLILELLPFKDAEQFHGWLNSIYVRGSWYEYSRDFLARNPLAPEPDKTKIAQQAKDAMNSRNYKYLMYHPEKDNWTADDHHVRFLVTLISDNILKGLWSESDWKKRNIEIAKACYEVLSFLRATAGPVDAKPPQYEG